MFKNYFKIAWVNLFRNKGFSIINILGLTTGMVCAIFILLWVHDELTFDKSHKNYNTIYQVLANRNFNNEIYTDYNLVFPLAKALEQGYPQIKNAVVTSGGGAHVFSYGDKKLKRYGLNASEHFFDMFTWKFLKGNSKIAIRDKSTIVLTESTAKALFGDLDPINKIITLDNANQVKVTAVIADPASNSSFHLHYVEPYSAEFEKGASQEWRNSFSAVYVQTVEGANIIALNKNINDIIKKHDPNDKISTYFSFPMSEWHLKSDFKDGINEGGMIEYVKLFSIIAIIILVIACINFMNLSTARSEKKAKEVGVRKTLGSSQKQLIIQFFCESLLYTFIAFVFSIALVLIFLPAFNSLVNKHITFDLTQPFIWLGAFAIILVTGIISGSYPALYLSSFNPARVLKGNNFTGKKALIPRRILVSSQFVISILLMSATIIVYQQIQYIKNRPTGYDAQNLIMIPSSNDLNKNYAFVKQELLKTGAIDAITRTSSPLTDIWWSSGAPDWNGKPKNGDIIVTGLRTDVDFTETLNLKILQGRYFSGVPSDSSAIIFNKTAIKTMGLKDPIGMEMRYGPNKYTVIGVVDDIVMRSPFEPVSPLMIYYDNKSSEYLNLKLNKSKSTAQCIQDVEKIIKKYNPSQPFEFQFVDESFKQKFITEELIGKLTNIFAGLAIFICCIGLAGLTAFTIEKRTREIGIRKILGATLIQLVALISNEFLKLVFIAFVITIPLTLLLMNKWLQNYAFHININAWMFVIVGVLVLALTLLIVFLNTLKTANNNPTKSLRSE